MAVPLFTYDSSAQAANLANGEDYIVALPYIGQRV